MDIQPSAVALPEGAAVRLALEFVRVLEAWGDAASFLTPDAIEEEFPNRIFAKGATRDLAAMKASMARGRELFATQRYVVHRAFGTDEVAALELEWRGELAVRLGNLAAGTTMRVRGAFFFEVSAGKISRLRHYDCFDAF